MRILGSDDPFKKVIGPMGVTIALLSSIGWTPVAPNKWADIDGGEWKYVGGSSGVGATRSSLQEAAAGSRESRSTQISSRLSSLLGWPAPLWYQLHISDEN